MSEFTQALILNLTVLAFGIVISIAACIKIRDFRNSVEEDLREIMAGDENEDTGNASENE